MGHCISKPKSPIPPPQIKADAKEAYRIFDEIHKSLHLVVRDDEKERGMNILQILSRTYTHLSPFLKVKLDQLIEECNVFLEEYDYLALKGSPAAMGVLMKQIGEMTSRNRRPSLMLTYKNTGFRRNREFIGTASSERPQPQPTN